MSRLEEYEKSMAILGAALDRFFWEGNPQKQTYSKIDILNLSIGLPVNDPVAIDFLMRTLRDWNRRRCIQLDEMDERSFVKVINPDFSSR